MVDLPSVQQLIAMNQEEMKEKYIELLEWLSDYVNQEISKFGCRIVLFGEASRNTQANITQELKTTQATLEWMDKVPQ